MVNASVFAQAADIPLRPEDVELARKGVAVFERNHASDASVRRMIDVAGEVLREHRLFWLDEEPLIRTYSDDEGAGLLYQLYVGVSAEEAARMTDEVIVRLIEREIEVPGLSIAFISKPQ